MLSFRGLLDALLPASDTDNDPTTHHPAVTVPVVHPVKLDYTNSKRDRTLVHLLRLNHHAHAVLYHDLIFHNHCPHYLGSAYLLGADEEELHRIYNIEDEHLQPWAPSPSEVTAEDWTEFWGDPRYQRAFLDFFEDEMVRQGYNWKKVLFEFLLKGERPLLNGLVGGLGHPLIHVGYALELDSREVALEALALGASCYNSLHKYVDEEIPSPGPNATTDPYEVLQRVYDDSRLDNFFESFGEDNGAKLLKEKEELFREYYHQLDIKNMDPDVLLNHLTALPTLMLTTTHKPGNPQYDFFICHVVTSSHGMRIVLPTLPSKHHLPLLKSHWLFTLYVYFIQRRPKIKPHLLDAVDVRNRDWDYVRRKAIGINNDAAGKQDVPDTHYMKALRMMIESAKLYKEDDEFYHKAAVKFADEFTDWVGFDRSDERLDIKD